MKKNSLFLIIILLVLLLTMACTIKQDININPDGSGSVALKVNLMDGYYFYLQELLEDVNDLGYDPEQGVFNTETIKAHLSELPGVTVINVLAPTPKKLEIYFNFEDINELSDKANTDPDAEKVFSLTYDGNRKKFRFYLDADNYHQIESLIPITDSPIYEALGPQPEYPISEEEYLELVEFTIGDNGPDMVKDSNVVTYAKVSGKLISQTGGIFTGGTAKFSLDMLKFLLLLEPMEFSFTFE